DFQARFEAASPMFQLAAAVAEYAEILRQSYWSKESRMSDVQALVRRLTDDLPQDEQVNDFLDLVNRAAALQR
ncbi:MAG: YfbK domain-containing protein, partial [Anaerolineae bacterium]